MNKSNIAERLFAMACAGDIGNLDTYYKITGSLNVTFQKFGEEHSLIMGAFRNRQWDTVHWLLDHGAALTASEQKEINDRYLEMVYIREMQNVAPKGKPIAP